VAGKENIICVGCPLGCLVTLTIDNGEVTAIKGSKCKQGKMYVIDEYRNPVRVLTTTLLTRRSSQPLLPVRTAVPISKNKILSGATALAEVTIEPPVRIGDIVVKKSAGIGADIVATADLLQ